jgi:stalled ribosome rescue protein Dom34
MKDDELARLTLPALDTAYNAQIGQDKELFEKRTGQGRAATDLTDVARAATYGAVELLFVDIDEVIPGTIDESGVVTLADTASARTYGVVDEIATRVLASGGRVIAIRRADIPGGGGVAAILRYAT